MLGKKNIDTSWAIQSVNKRMIDFTSTTLISPLSFVPCLLSILNPVSLAQQKRLLIIFLLSSLTTLAIAQSSPKDYFEKVK